MSNDTDSPRRTDFHRGQRQSNLVRQAVDLLDDIGLATEPVLQDAQGTRRPSLSAAAAGLPKLADGFLGELIRLMGWTERSPGRRLPR